MNNVFIIGLHRTGSTFLESLLYKNIEGCTFRGKIINVRDNAAYVKTTFPTIIDEFSKDKRYPQDGYILIHRNPYMWVERFLYNDSDTDADFEGNIFGNNFLDFKLCLKEKVFGESIYNLDELLRLYKNFYTEWMNTSVSLYVCKYEDLLPVNRSSLEGISNWSSSQVKDEISMPNTVKYSSKFNSERLDYNIAQKPTRLNGKTIDKINNVLGVNLINSLGYEIL